MAQRRWAAVWAGATLAILAAAPEARGGECVFENARFRAVLGEDATWTSLVDKASGEDCLAPGRRIPLAAITLGSKTHQTQSVVDPWNTAARSAEAAGKTTHEANAADLSGDTLTIGFAGTDTRFAYAVETEPDWIALRLVRVTGARPTHATVLRIGVAITEHVGPRLNAGWDDRQAVCLMATTLQSHGAARRKTDHAELTVTAQDEPGPRLEGSGAALVAAPTAALDGILRRLAVAYDLPRNEGDGTPSKALPVARGSYWFLRFGEADVDKVIDACRQSGFRQVMMGSQSWCRTAGHYTFNTVGYPDGVESLRRMVERLHAEGILVGMHCYASKVAKADPYVTPVPDRRFLVDRAAALAADVGPDDKEIRMAGDLREWPGSPLATQKLWEGGVVKHQEVILGDEIVKYKAIRLDEKGGAFLECERGAWGTRAAAHRAGAEGRHYAVDGCINGYLIDQETTLLDEATTRLAEIFNTCGFDMVYFDGGEDVDKRRFAYYVSKFQQVAMSKFRKRPLVHMGTILTHNLWHSFTRSGTVDTYMNTQHGRIISGEAMSTWPTVKQHIDTSVRYMLSVRDDRLPGELGWFGIWPKGKNTDGLQLDEVEYLMARSYAYDAPVSLETSFTQMASHPLTPGVLEIIRVYEGLRLSRPADEATAARLRPSGKDFILLQGTGAPEFVEAQPVGEVAGSRDLRAFVGERPGGAVATLWHYTGNAGRLLVAADPATVRAEDLFRKPVEIGRVGGKAAIPFGARRTTLYFDGLSAEAVRQLLAKAALDGQ